MSEEQRDDREGFELRGWHVIVGILAILVILFILFRVFGHSALEKKIAELVAKGYPTTFEDLEKYNQLPEGTPNAADLYVQAFETYQAPFGDETKLLPYVKAGALKPGEPNAPQMATMKTFLSRNAKSLEFLHQAAMIQECRYCYPVTGSMIFMNPHLQDLKKCSTLLSIRILEQASAGTAESACQGMIDQLHLGESLSGDPVLISYLVRIGVKAMAISSVETVLNRLSLNETELANLQAQLLRVRNGLSIDRALVGERCFLLDKMSLRQNLGLGTAPLRWSGLVDTNLLRCLEYYDRLEAIAKLEPEKRLEEYRRFEEDVSNLPFWFTITKWFMPSLQKIGLIDMRVIAQFDCARAALGVERFRKAEGRLPAALEEVVPRYLEVVPIDPFDRKPLRYKRLEKGYIIYTIGDDGQDNGGATMGKVQKDEKYDWPFTVERE